jgi:hypothetical protein
VKPKPNICMRCGGFKIDRPDDVPFCNECEKKMTAEWVRLRPDKAKKPKIVSERTSE